ncbi:hypothetical protein CRENPOLYSF1_1010003 [Crenothrix polyspora]|uniref:Uncharacterized protein n=1 Tax=Crenothrix polyspora TaxID=360316 RepID=A0A1R4GZP7_9GAMM|nr:hypothetical protein CRENPOLYSF1_1010003 [Crenothrix polyspora]
MFYNFCTVENYKSKRDVRLFLQYANFTESHFLKVRNRAIYHFYIQSVIKVEHRIDL